MSSATSPAVNADPGPRKPAPDPPLTAEDKERLVQYFRDVLSGRKQPTPMVTPEIVRAELAKVKKEYPRTLDSALRRIEDEWNLQYHHGGQLVAIITNAQGRKCVLAVGQEEVALFFAEIPASQCSHVLAAGILPWGYAGRCQ